MALIYFSTSSILTKYSCHNQQKDELAKLTVLKETASSWNSETSCYEDIEESFHDCDFDNFEYDFNPSQKRELNEYLHSEKRNIDGSTHKKKQKKEKAQAAAE